MRKLPLSNPSRGPAVVPIFGTMIRLDDTLVSDDLQNVRFCCDLRACKGSCCVEGDAGAPLEEEEISLLEDALDEIRPYMSERGREIVEEAGVFEYDAEGSYVTPLINGKECAFAIFDEESIAQCAIEKAWQDGRTGFQKPVSCHLYPVRIGTYSHFEAINYHQWHICKAAVRKGSDINQPLYRFLEDPLKRKYGAEWYNELVRLLK